MDLYLGPGPFAMNSFPVPAQRKVVDTELEDLLLEGSPFETRDGRPYLRDQPYFLPCDLTELHSQSLRTMLYDAIFFGPTLASLSSGAPKKVLEVGCGSGFWSSMCHQHFKSMGHSNVAFSGIDIVSLAPDTPDKDMDWTFVQHDFTTMPWPFPDDEFDLIMVKDCSLAVPLDKWQALRDECIRVLSEGGTIEIRESDHILQCLVQSPQPSLASEATMTYQITPATALSQAQNKFIQDANSWIDQACDRVRVSSTPCSRMGELLNQAPSDLHKPSSLRIAVPLAELAWESTPGRRSSSAGKKHKGRSSVPQTILNVDQAALRRTALMTVIQKIEGLEPVLKERSGKNTEEWSTWWASMMSSLVEHDGASTGEFLEMGAWWAKKRTRSR